MATDVIMPALGMAQETGKVLRWLKVEGDPVTQGEPLLEIETDKASAELDAPATGVLANVTAAVGDDVPVGRVIALILAPGETAPVREAIAPGPAATAAPVAALRPAAVPAAVPPGGLPASPVPSNEGPSGRVAASPRARRLARERGVVPKQAGPTALSTTWRLMAERTTQTWTTTPHFFLTRQVEATRLIAWRSAHQRLAGPGVTYTDLLVRLVAAALRLHLDVNVKWDNGRIIRIQEINIGVAVATDEGLVVPVIHGVERLALVEISRRRAELVAKAREGRLRAEDLSGGTFTISNLGMYAVDAFTAILNAPQAAILAVGRIADRVVAVDGQPVVRPVLVLSLSCDHRAVDGARAGRFLESLADLIEEPASLIE